MQIQRRTARLIMTKSVDIDNKCMSDEPLSRKLICSRLIEEKMIEFQKINHEKYLQYKDYSAKTHDKDHLLHCSKNLGPCTQRDEISYYSELIEGQNENMKVRKLSLPTL